MTRKNMGGVAIDMQARVLNRQGAAVPGLYAAGEITGSVGINGSHGMDGTFLGPAIVTGRLAGRTIAGVVGSENRTSAPAPEALPGQAAFKAEATATDLQPLLASPRQGYWHFEVSHKIVVERKYSCGQCHSPELPFAPVTTRAQRNAQTQVCINCHDR